MKKSFVVTTIAAFAIVLMVLSNVRLRNCMETMDKKVS